MKKLLLISQILFVIQFYGQSAKKIVLLTEADFQKTISTIGNNNLDKYDYYFIYKNESNVKIAEGIPSTGIFNKNNENVFVIIRDPELNDIKYLIDENPVKITEPIEERIECKKLVISQGSEIILEIK